MTTKRHPGGVHQLDLGYTGWLGRMHGKAKTHPAWEPAVCDPESLLEVTEYSDDGFVHGWSGYTDGGCRCSVCKEANAAHSRAGRARRKEVS